MIRCRVRIGKYDKKMTLEARACARRATHIVGDIPICAEHVRRLASDNIIYSVHPNGDRLPRTMPQKFAV